MGESISPIFFLLTFEQVQDQAKKQRGTQAGYESVKAKKHKRGVQAGYESMYSTHRMEVWREVASTCIYNGRNSSG